MSSSVMSTLEAQSMAQYMSTFLDLVDNVPNEITRHLTQLHQLHNNYLKLMSRMDTNVNNYKQLMATFGANNSCNNSNTTNSVSESSYQVFVDNRKRLTKKIETQLIQMQELSDEKLKYSQLILDLIEIKAKELDLDYEEILQFKGNNKLGNNSIDNSIISSNNNNKLSAINATQQQLAANVANAETAKEHREANEENSNSRLNDKRLLPRRACAVKSGGQTVDVLKESNDELINGSANVSAKQLTQSKTSLKTSKAYSKSHNFGLSMSNFYRDMARRRAKLPKVSKMSTTVTAIKLKEQSSKKSVPAVKRTAKTTTKTNSNNKTNRKSIKRQLIGANNSSSTSAAKQTNNGSANVIQNSNTTKKLIRNNKSSNSYCDSSSTTSSSSSSSSMSCEDILEDNKVSTSGTNMKTVDKNERNSYQSNSNNRKESSKTTRANNGSSNAVNGTTKKSKNNSKASEESLQLFGEPIDPNEPTYCLCAQVSYGEMICCDNQMCPIEWFHFPCVDLVHKPKGKWFCPNCRKGDKHSVPKR